MSMDWTELKLFKGIDLNDSFVLNWTHIDDQLTFELEASVWPESLYYSTPKANEYTCYRKAVLKFANTQKISGLNSMDSVQSTTDLDGSKDYGNIDTLCQTESGFNLSGDFGSVTIQGGELSFEVHT